MYTERVVQKLTGNPNYRFGDFTKGALRWAGLMKPAAAPAEAAAEAAAAPAIAPTPIPTDGAEQPLTTTEAVVGPDEVWAPFFVRVLDETKAALLDEWLLVDELVEPFCILGLPSLAFADLVVRSLPVDNGLTLHTGLTLFEANMPPELRPLFHKLVEARNIMAAEPTWRTPNAANLVQHLKLRLLANPALDTLPELPGTLNAHVNQVAAAINAVATQTSQLELFRRRYMTIVAEVEEWAATEPQLQS